MLLIKLLREFGKRQRLYLLGVLLFQLASTIAALYLPSLNAHIIDDGVSKGDVGFIWSTGATMLVVAILQAITAVAGVYCGAKAAMGVGRDIRRRVYAKVMNFSGQELARFGAPTLITRGTNDVQQVQMALLLGLNFAVSAPIMCIGGVIMALREDVGLSWLVWVSVAVLLAAIGYLVAQLVPLFKGMQGKIDGINRVMREQIMGIRVVRAFVRERFETSRFAAANADLTQLSLRIGSYFVLLFPVITVILHLATSAVLWFGGQRVDEGSIAVGSLTAFLQYLLQILTAVMMATFMVMMIPRAVVGAERISEVLDVEPSMTAAQNLTSLEHPEGKVEFRDVTFCYPGAEKPVLSNISFTAEPGQTVAIIGGTGSGKTSLLGLIPRLADPASGQVLIDGVSVNQISRASMSRTVALVPQKPYLFSGTVASNLRFSNPQATDEQLWEALRVAQAADFVEKKPEKLDAPISQGGTNVSGGQRQRLSIARALVAEPRIYLFDDSFSALDVATDARLRKALGPHIRGATAIIVAQRVATIMDADHIIVLENGQIVSSGTHEELLASSETYQQIVGSQMSAEEVA